MKTAKIVIICVFATFAAYAQNTTIIKKGAEAIVKATINNDFKTVAKYTYPAMVKSMGGEQRIIETMNNAIAQINSKGITIRNAVIGQPGEILNTGTRLYSIIPEKIFMSANDKKFFANGTLLAISTDKGATWTYVDASNRGDALLNQFFPYIKGRLVIPKQSAPIEY